VTNKYTSFYAVRQAITFKICVELAASTAPYPTGEEPLTACSLPLVAGRQLEMKRISPENARKQFEVIRAVLDPIIRAIRRERDSDSAFAELTSPATLQPEAMAYYRLHRDLAGGKLFFLTDDRYMGLAPLDTIEGDRVCVILGCSVPFIVRPTADGWIQVGECYVHGLMEGEAMDMEDIEIQDIRLI